MSDKAEILVRVYDGRKRLFAPGGKDFLFRVFDGSNEPIHTLQRKKSSVKFRVPYYDNLRDRYRVVVSAGGFDQAAFFPVEVQRDEIRTVELMLVPHNWNLDFGAANWERLKTEFPILSRLLSNDVATEALAKARYNDLLSRDPEIAAALFNITTVMTGLKLDKRVALSYLRCLVWDETMARDRFFAYAESSLIAQLDESAVAGHFKSIAGSEIFHPGATKSYKQLLFDQANLQVTLHENDRTMIDGIDCFRVELDIDYFGDIGGHTVHEVIPNTATGGKSNPLTVFALLWMAARNAGVELVEPPYLINEA